MTLVEKLCVTLVIGILAALLLTSIGRAYSKIKLGAKRIWNHRNVQISVFCQDAENPWIDEVQNLYATNGATYEWFKLSNGRASPASQ